MPRNSKPVSKPKSGSKPQSPPSATSGDLKKLQGAWNVTALEADGQKIPHAAIAGSQIVIERKKFTSIAMGAAYQGTVEIHATQSPKAFDLVFTAGPEKGNRNLGIYKLNGDIWTICLATQGNQRPRKFATQAGAGIALETLERAGSGKSAKQPGVVSTAHSRAKKAAAVQPGVTKNGLAETGAAGDGSPTELEGEWAMASGVFNGQPLDPSMVKFCKRVTRGNVTTVLAGPVPAGRGPQTMLQVQFTLDRSKNPNHIDYVNLQGANKGKSQLGIFELSGASLKMCVAPPGQPRPADFSSKRGDGRNYTVWRLDKK
jgi:uncharacterized protein (TIGR03067 family)